MSPDEQRESVARPSRRVRAGFSIAEVVRRTGIPASTLRFYEREMPGLFLIRKTEGGHRRYTEEDLARFAAIRRLTETDSVPLAQVRRILSSRGDHEPLREEVARLRASHEEQGWTIAELSRRVGELEKRLETAGGRKGWFRK